MEAKTLPEPGKPNVLVTSALPYVNNVPHLGNIIGSVLSADVFARYCRGRGINTLYVGGTDEYGASTEARALKEGCTCKELCDKYHALHANVYNWFNISFDVFGRTTTKLQTKITHDIFRKLNDNGLLTEQRAPQLYCKEPKHNAFLSDRFVEGECPRCAYPDARGDQCDSCGHLLDTLDLKNPRCKIDGTTPTRKKASHIFFELDKLQNEVETFVREAIDAGQWSRSSEDINLACLKEGLKAMNITRDLQWGTPVPLPNYESKILYPWFDACIGYVSITADYTDQWEKWWRNPEHVQLYQFLGKDNVVFHSIIFPATQIGTGEIWTKVHHLSATDYLTYEGEKFSKSRGVGVFGDSAQATGIESDVWRFFLLRRRPENGDTEFNWESFIDDNNNELVDNVGNFVHRVLEFVRSEYNGTVPDGSQYHDVSLRDFQNDIDQLLSRYNGELESVRLRSGIAIVLSISKRGSRFLDTINSNPSNDGPTKCAAVISLAVNLVRLLAAVIAPYMPDTAMRINRQLGVDANEQRIPDRWSPDSIKIGHKLGEPVHLFWAINAEKAHEWRREFGSKCNVDIST